MNNIEKLLIDLNYDFKVTSRKIKPTEIKMYIANKKEKNKVLAKYLIFDFIEEHDLFEKISTDSSLFDKFQRLNISPIFFSHRDDIRWNIYTLFVVNNKENLPVEVYNIEKNEEYARKVIFNINELNEFLDKGFLGNLDRDLEQKIKTDFLLEWDIILGKLGLNGCIKNKMKTASIEEYIENEKPIRPSGRPSTNKSNTILRNDVFISRIQNIKMNSYRAHCFGREFSYSPGLVNLISGSNGSGKSSLCEAISFGMTGTNSNNKENSDESIYIECLNEKDEIINLSSQKTSKEKKEYDLAWYGTTTTGYKSNLYENFSIFNYLQSNSAHKGIQSNIDVLLKNIMYGEETTVAWESINKYKEKFIQFQSNYDKSIKKLQGEVKELESNLKEIKSLDKVYELEKSDPFGLLNKYPEDVTYETKLNDLNNLSFIVSSLEKDIEADIEMNSVHYIINSYGLSKERKRKFEKQYRVYEELYDRGESLKVQVENMNADIKQNNEFKIELKKLLVEYFGYDYLSFDSKSDRKKFIEDFNNKKNVFKFMNETLNKFNIFKDINKSIAFSENELLQVNKELSKNKELRLEMCDEISSKKSNVKLSKQILTEIFALGVKYLNEHNDTGACPLCGFDYGASNKVHEAINNVRSLVDNLDVELESLIIQENNLNEDIEKIEKRKEILLKDKETYVKYSEFVSEMKKYDIESSEETPKVFYESCCLKRDELSVEIEKKMNVVDFLEKLNSNGVFIEFNEQDDINEFSKYIEHTLTKYDRIQKKIRIDIKSISEEQNKIQGKLKERSIVESKLDKANSEFTILSRAYKNINFIINSYPAFAKVTDVQKWILNFNNLKSIFRELVETEKNTKMNNIIFSKTNKKKKELESNNKSLDRCKRAIEAFDSLPTLEENMTPFIEENAANIEKIFKMIHRPEEFTNLIIENGKVRFTRRTTGEIINIEDVSTGQAISLVFAITLCLHFSASNAPKFIILDEPVANLDDMHIMNLVDILREVALSGVQLFITTANDQVATYFRRKFSCFSEEFKNLAIIRLDERPSTFSEKVYSPYQEEPVINKEIAI